MTALSAADPIDLGAMLSDDEKAITESVRSFVKSAVLDEIAEWFEEARFPARELAKPLGEIGLLGMHLEGYGCAATSATAYGLACLELEAGDSGLRSFVSVQGSLAMFPIRAYGSEEQREQWLPGMAAGELIGCFGLTEPDSGSDPASMRTAARRDGADWILNGTKTWITNGSIADVAVVWARTDEGIRGFVVPSGTAGFEQREIHHKMSLRASSTGELVFDDVRLPAEAVLPGVVGIRGPLSCLNEARFGILFGALGAGRASFEAALAYAGDRTQFGKPIAGFQLTQHKFADMAVRMSQGLTLALHLGRLKDSGGLKPDQISIGKLANVRTAIEICRTARTILGANGISLEYPVIRHMTNLESVLTYEGTEEVHALIIGKGLTGLAAFA
ncbi:acyl-CoA dehydrogenase family protein [Mycolicibacterium parafortuitum]|uniref:glutaryl-CoA dehydrogenase (ETF) n=1 Tax=Mycolicibacterium parafortuitum TaxID=39692 RepID=A0A375YLY2_MYCPF|nr:acyl-CoA dehydrogenase family protein [Mycolicibacterium parafortuitum]ORB30010.1 acyl-CoA dehydrogenase [Mycolicibacterium parafortuitum]SRX82091.1 acyl-CoA dehydrogenase domain-containing protein [Thermobispora bispora DSM] [Mycolicibacterium parafortuitum]